VSQPSQTCKLRCPACGHYLSKVIDSRAVGRDQPAIRRRRACLECNARYSTVERVVADSVKSAHHHI
jgi:transcriptional regulator NrdR family protein